MRQRNGNVVDPSALLVARLCPVCDCWTIVEVGKGARNRQTGADKEGMETSPTRALMLSLMRPDSIIGYRAQSAIAVREKDDRRQRVVVCEASQHLLGIVPPLLHLGLPISLVQGVCRH